MSEYVVDIEGCSGDCDLGINLWVKDLLPRTPGAVRKVVKREVELACREFFEQSLAWRGTFGPRDLKSGMRRYIMSPYDAYADVTRVMSIELNGRELRPLNRRPAGDEPTNDLPVGFWLDEPDVVRFWPTPSTTVEDALRFHVALTPKNCVSKLPRIAQTHFYDAILDGALGRLYAHPAKPYTNPTLAQYHLQRFRAAIGKYSSQAKSGFTSVQTWTYPRFGK